MPQPQKSQIRQQLTSLISPQLIRRRARSLGVVKRRRVDPVALVYVLVLGFGHGRARTLALTSCDTAEIGHRLGEWSHGKSIDDKHRPSEARREADWIAHDTATLCDVGARLQARLLSTPRGALSDGAEQIIHRGLVGLFACHRGDGEHRAREARAASQTGVASRRGTVAKSSSSAP